MLLSSLTAEKKSWSLGEPMFSVLLISDANDIPQLLFSSETIQSFDLLCFAQLVFLLLTHFFATFGQM